MFDRFEESVSDGEVAAAVHFFAFFGHGAALVTCFVEPLEHIFRLER